MSDVFLFILRILFVILLYLFLMFVVWTIRSYLKKPTTPASTSTNKKFSPFVGRLVVIDSSTSTTLNPGDIFELVAPRTTIGHGPTSTIRLYDSFISAEHTQLEYKNGKWFVEDSGSKNGTYVNSAPAYQHQSLPAKDGDSIYVGPIRFQLMLRKQ